MLRDKNGYYIDHRTLYPLLGLNKGSHLPRDGFTQVVQGVTYRCDPIVQADGKKSSRHRLRFLCNCDRWIPFGRASQHIPACKRKGFWPMADARHTPNTVTTT